jgi:hypothetical protein
MDELTLLRELEADTPPPSAHARYRARMQLRYEIAYERRPRRKLGLAPVLATAAAGAAMAVVLVALEGDEAAAPEPRVQLTAAADALHLAALVARAESTGPIPRDDQYLYRKEITEERPVDGTGRTRTVVDENWVSVDGSRPSRNSELGNVWYTTGQGWPPMRFEELRRLPTDPGRLVLAVSEWPAGGRESSEPMSEDDFITAYFSLSALLYHQPPMPPELRAAAYDALARIPGVEIVDDEVDLRGRRGLAISRPVAGADQAIILDAATHEYLGFRNTDVREDGERIERISSRLGGGVVDEIGERP